MTGSGVPRQGATLPARAGVHEVPVTVLGDGRPLTLTVHVVTGRRPGPKLVMFGSIHGDEPLSSEIIRRTLGALSPSALSGTIVAVPVANPLAHQTLTRNTPLDGCNLNRIFPGDRVGTVSEQLAAVLSAILRDGATHFIDFHSGGNFAFVDYSYLHDPGAEMSRAFGRPLLYAHDSYEGTSTGYALSLGIPSMVSELAGGSQRIGEYLRYGVEGAFRVLRVIGMLEPGPVVDLPPQRIVETLTVLRPTVAGTLLSQYDAATVGDSVPEGSVLGVVIDPYTFEELEVIRAPYSPSILVLVRAEVTHVLPGDYGFMVADGATARLAG
ncbi:MAG: succinylglutamate desuccinylase/aspartoacylase family protein [Candidatus Dormibacteria bacterium]